MPDAGRLVVASYNVHCCVGTDRRYDPERVARVITELDADVGARLGETPALRTFPSRRPIFPLDRLWLQPRTALIGIRVVATGLTRAASDHLPLRAEISLPAASAS